MEITGMPISTCLLLLFLICRFQNVLGQQSCSGATLNLTLNTDNYPNETSWKLNHISGNLVASEGPYASNVALVVKKSFCLTQTPECYSFTISDLAADGICCDFGNGSYNLTLDGSPVPSAGNFVTASQTVWLGRGCIYTAKPTSKPTTSLRPTVTTTSRPSSLRPTSIPNNTFNLTITFDQWPDETSWSLKTLTGSVILNGGPYGSSFDSQTISVNKVITILPQCYLFTILDAAGDGMCCSFGAGSYRIVFNGLLIKTGGSFASSESTYIGAACSKIFTRKPTRKPTSKPTKKPTRKPTRRPTKKPTAKPTERITTNPSSKPTEKPTSIPTSKLSEKPTSRPTEKVTTNPSSKPTKRPTSIPTSQLTVETTSRPTEKVTMNPSSKPTSTPTLMPSSIPTRMPTSNPSFVPTTKPTSIPTILPTTSKPSMKPTASPSLRPSLNPTRKSSNRPTQCVDQTDLFTYQLGPEIRNITCQKISHVLIKFCRSDYPSILKRCPNACSRCNDIPSSTKPTLSPSTSSLVPTSVVTSRECADASKAFPVLINGKEGLFTCSKLASSKFKVYCSLYSEIRTQCPVKCDRCTPILTRKPSLAPTNCRDKISSFLVVLDGVTKPISCRKVALANSYYCPLSKTIARNCPVTCGNC